MTALLHELLTASAERALDVAALKLKRAEFTYVQVARLGERFASGLRAAGLSKQERVAVYLPKRPETVVTIFGATQAVGVLVPINPLPKPPQVVHILRDRAVRVLVTSAQRAAELADSSELRLLVTVDGVLTEPSASQSAIGWDDFLAARAGTPHRVIDTDMAAILYTLGSTGKPKGVVLSHKNMFTGTKSLARCLGNRGKDRLLAQLPRH
jgi:acyl-CoA synthetase (AMP-forming)/AMP-acid ligase II